MKGGTGEEDLNKKISELLQGELDGLPPEGGEVNIRVKVNGDMVGGNKTVIVTPPKEVPEGNPNRRECPQCYKVTWSGTETCMHCDCNLFAYDAQVRLEAVKVRKTKALAFFGFMAFSCMYIGQYAPAPYKSWVVGVGAVSALFAMSLLR